MSDTALALPEAVLKRLEEAPSDEMLGMIDEYLEDASDQARFHGREWTQANCPAPVSRLVAAAVARFIRNPDGFEQNRAAEETISWQDTPFVGRVYFYQDEIERIALFGKPKLPAFGTMQMYAHQSLPAPETTVYVPVLGGKRFPLFRVT